MTDIVKFPAKAKVQEPLIWVCQCGCSTFELRNDGTGRCALCGDVIRDDAEGGWLTPETDKEWEGDDPVRDVSGNGDPDFARRVTAKRVLEDDVVLVVILKESGAISTWTIIETQEQREWADRQLDRVSDILSTGRK